MQAKAIAILTTGFILISGAVAAQTADTADWTPAAAGTTFVFANSTGSDDVIKVLAVDGITIKRDTNGTESEEVGLQINVSSREYMPDSSRKKAAALWPLKVGNTTSFSHGGTTSSGNSWSSSDNAEVSGTEEVTVPAGTFKTFVIKTSMTNLPWFEGKWTCWYAPEIGYCAKTRWQRSGSSGTPQDLTRELKSVTKAQ